MSKLYDVNFMGVDISWKIHLKTVSVINLGLYR